MAVYGAVVGKFEAITPMGGYMLDVRFDLQSKLFYILVPKERGGRVSLKNRDSFEVFSEVDLDEAKEKAVSFMRKRDQTTFEDVIVYDLPKDWSLASYNQPPAQVGFRYQVARVSTSQNSRGIPLLEISVEVTEDGVVTPKLLGDSSPVPYRQHWAKGVIPFTLGAFRACERLAKHIASLSRSLDEVFDGKPEVVVEKLEMLAVLGENWVLDLDGGEDPRD